MIQPISNFTTVDTMYGKWIVSRHAQYHAESLIKTGITCIQEEVNLMVTIANTLPENCILVDVGFNMGMVSIPLATAVKDKSGRVYSFEVQKQLFYALCGTIVLNDLDNLEAFNCGIGDEQKVLKIPKVDYTENKDYGLVSLGDQTAIGNQAHDTVDIFPLDYFEYERLDFIKIDVEGMELEVLKGGEKTIKAHRPWAYIEYWNVDQVQLKSWFDGMDYTLYSLPGGNILCCPNEKMAAAEIVVNAPLF